MDHVWQFNSKGESKISTTTKTWQIQDGRSINENYGTDLDKLEEGDRVGVLRTSQGDLLFFVNGVSQVSIDLRNSLDFQKVRWNLLKSNPQGVAASNLPTTVFAVIDMYGKCAQVISSLFLIAFAKIINRILFRFP